MSFLSELNFHFSNLREIEHGGGKSSIFLGNTRKEMINNDHIDSDNQLQTIKVTPLNNNEEIRRFEERIHFLQKLQEANISCILHETFILQLPSQSYPKLGVEVMENMESDLLSFLLQNPQLGESTLTKQIFKKICISIHYLHFNQIVHNNLKLENILITAPPSTLLSTTANDDDDDVIYEFDLRLCGFSRSIMVDRDLRSSTRIVDSGDWNEYIHPQLGENYRNNNIDIDYDYKKVDIYALGVILFALITGTFPVVKNNQGIMMMNVKYKLENRSVSTCCIDLILNMLSDGETNRPNIEDIITGDWLSTTRCRSRCVFNCER